MGFTKKEWKDRKTEYPSRRLLTKEDGSTELVTVSREEGTVSEEGDAFSAENMNDLERRISEAVDKEDIPLISTYDDLMANTMSGYVADAMVTKEGFEKVNNYLGFCQVITPSTLLQTSDDTFAIEDIDERVRFVVINQYSNTVTALLDSFTIPVERFKAMKSIYLSMASSDWKLTLDMSIKKPIAQGSSVKAYGSYIEIYGI